MNEIIQNLAVYALPVIFAITLHEAAHAYAAKYFGDTTAYAQGRMTLNPIKHIDPIGTILIPVVLYAVSSPFLFGYAKPVPVNFNALRNPKRDMAWVALAGPVPSPPRSSPCAQQHKNWATTALRTANSTSRWNPAPCAPVPCCMRA